MAFDFSKAADVSNVDGSPAVKTQSFDFSKAQDAKLSPPATVKGERPSVFGTVARWLMAGSPLESIKRDTYLLNKWKAQEGEPTQKGAPNPQFNWHDLSFEAPPGTPEEKKNHRETVSKIQKDMADYETDQAKKPLQDTLAAPLSLGFSEFALAKPAAAVAMGVGYQVSGKFVDLRKYVEHNWPQAWPEIKDLAEITDLMVKGGVMASGAQFGKSFFGGRLRTLGLPQSFNLNSEHINAVDTHPDLSPANKSDFYTTLGVTEAQKTAAQNAGIPVNVQADRMLDLVQKPYWSSLRSTMIAEKEPQEESILKTNKTIQKIKNGTERAGLSTRELFSWTRKAMSNVFNPYVRMIGKHGGEAYADVIKAEHLSDKALLGFDNNKSQIFDKTFKEIGEWFNGFSKQDRENFMLTRGDPESTDAKGIKEEAFKKLPPELQDFNMQAAMTEMSDWNYRFAVQNGTPLHYFKDYFFGRYKADQNRIENFMEYWKSTDAFRKTKRLPTPADAKAFGLSLDDTNPFENIRKETQIIAQRIGREELRDRMLSPYVKAAAVVVNGKKYLGESHDEALENASRAGEDIQNFDKEKDGMFMTSDKRMITRDEAQKEFGIKRSSQIPTQAPIDRAQAQEMTEIKPVPVVKQKFRTLIGEILRRGGIDISKAKAAGYTYEDFKQFGLLSVLRKGGMAPDSLASEMINQNMLLNPEGKSPSDALLEHLKYGRKEWEQSFNDLENDYERQYQEAINKEKDYADAITPAEIKQIEGDVEEEARGKTPEELAQWSGLELPADTPRKTAEVAPQDVQKFSEDLQAKGGWILSTTRNPKGGFVINYREPEQKIPQSKKSIEGSDAKLPQDLRGAKPRYSYGSKQFDLEFENDIEKAAYITAQKTKSARDKDYVDFVKKSKGLTENEVRLYGQEVKGFIKNIARDQEEGTIRVPKNLSEAEEPDITPEKIIGGDEKTIEIPNSQVDSFSSELLDRGGNIGSMEKSEKKGYTKINYRDPENIEYITNPEDIKFDPTGETKNPKQRMIGSPTEKEVEQDPEMYRGQQVQRFDRPQGFGSDIIPTKEPKVVVNFAVRAYEANMDQMRHWVKIQDPVFDGYLFDPDYARFVNNLIETNRISQNPFLSGLRQTARISQASLFSMSMFHMRNEVLAALADELGGMFNAKGAGNVIKALGKPLEYNSPLYEEYVGLGGGHGYSAEVDAERGLTGFLENLSNGTLRVGPVKAVYKGATRFVPGSPEMVKWMFEDFIPRLKYNKWAQEVEGRELALGRPLQDSEKIGIIRDNNNLYGELNERLFGRSGTVTSALRIVFSAPGYGEGHFRALYGSTKEIQEMLKAGKIPKEGIRNLRFIVASFANIAILSAVGTKIMTGQWPSAPQDGEDVRDQLKIKTTLKDGNNDDVFFDMASYSNDFYSLYGNILTGQPDKIIPTLYSRVAGAQTPEFKMLVDFSNVVAGKPVYDYKGDPVFLRTDDFTSAMSKLMSYEMLGAVPISLSTYGALRKKGVDPATAGLASVAGVQPTTSEKVKTFKKARQDMFSLETGKRSKQVELDQLYTENPDRALDEVKRFNEAQLLKLGGITKKIGASNFDMKEVAARFLVTSLKGKSVYENTQEAVRGLLRKPAKQQRTRVPLDSSTQELLKEQFVQ